jgi:cold shock CspA family protein
MVGQAAPATALTGRVAHVEASRAWGYLHGVGGARVYFHASIVDGGMMGLNPGDEVSYTLATGGDQLCAAQVVRPARRGR